MFIIELRFINIRKTGKHLQMKYNGEFRKSLACVGVPKFSGVLVNKNSSLYCVTQHRIVGDQHKIFIQEIYTDR